MRFHSTIDRTITFDIARQRYTVPPRGQVDIPDRVAYVVEAHGLPLAEGPGADGAPEATVASFDPSLESLLSHAPRDWADGFRAAWAKAPESERARMLARLKREVETKIRRENSASDPDAEGEAEEPDEQDTDEDIAAVDKAVAEAAAKVGRGRRGR